MMKYKYGGLIAAPLLALALPLLASCGGSGSPTSAQVAALGGSASASASPTSSSDPYHKALAYSVCMRTHGVKNFPDPTVGPDGTVGLMLKSGSGIDPNSSVFKSAQQSCQSLQPGGKDGGKSSFDPAKIAPWAACIRKHGEPHFPDPANTGSGMKIDLSGTGIEPRTLQPAIQACDSLNPGGTLQITSGSGNGGAGSGG
jgi:hypothetical protein